MHKKVDWTAWYPGGVRYGAPDGAKLALLMNRGREGSKLSVNIKILPHDSLPFSNVSEHNTELSNLDTHSNNCDGRSCSAHFFGGRSVLADKTSSWENSKVLKKKN